MRDTINKPHFEARKHAERKCVGALPLNVRRHIGASD
jgi:hypothetical protein